MRFRYRVAALAAAIAAIIQTEAMAADTSADGGAKLGVTFEADIEYGGDDIATVSFTDGSSQNIKTGSGLTLALGGQFKPNEDSPFAVRTTAGYKFVTTAARDADIGIDRFVLELLGSYRFANNVWVGLGVTQHSNIKFDGDGFGPDVDFDDATGFTGEVGWKWIALSYTAIDYTDEFGDDWDAGSIGLTLTSKF